jgi:hypothetical protein
MRYVKWGFWITLAVLVFAFFHYTLPQRDIVRIVGTDSRRIDVGENSIFWARPEVGMADSANRDVFFIRAIQTNGRPMEYRNEDTGWGWPPYFKINSSSLQTQATSLISTEENPKWVAITHYGWRNNFFTIFPNATSVRVVEGPDVTLIPWMNIVILTVLAGLLFMLWRMWAQFRERMIDPAIEDMGVAIDNLDARADQARANARTRWGRFKAWLAGTGRR